MNSEPLTGSPGNVSRFVCVWGPSYLDAFIFDVPSMGIRHEHEWAKYLAECPLASMNLNFDLYVAFTPNFL
jgi:hypothetical protein